MIKLRNIKMIILMIKMMINTFRYLGKRMKGAREYIV